MAKDEQFNVCVVHTLTHNATNPTKQQIKLQVPAPKFKFFSNYFDYFEY